MRRRLIVVVMTGALVAGPAAIAVGQTEGTGRTPGTPRQESTQGRTERMPGTGRTPGTPRTGRPGLPATGLDPASIAQDAAALIAAGALMIRLRRRFA